MHTDNICRATSETHHSLLHGYTTRSIHHTPSPSAPKTLGRVLVTCHPHRGVAQDGNNLREWCPALHGQTLAPRVSRRRCHAEKPLQMSWLEDDLHRTGLGCHHLVCMARVTLKYRDIWYIHIYLGLPFVYHCPLLATRRICCKGNSRYELFSVLVWQCATTLGIFMQRDPSSL